VACTIGAIVAAPLTAPLIFVIVRRRSTPAFRTIATLWPVSKPVEALA
jgi:hypothetical protein